MELSELVLGLQHIGIPTKDLRASETFYETLGFTVVFRGKHGPYLEPVSFLERGGLMLECYQTKGAVGADGAVDHIALDVTDIEVAYEESKEQGFHMLTEKIEFLPFFENGVRYFIIEGPNKERIELNQKL